MEKDYKDRVPGLSSGAHHAPPGWLWFAAGVLAGGFFAGLVCLKTGGLHPVTDTSVSQAPLPAAVQSTEVGTSTKTEEPPKPTRERKETEVKEPADGGKQAQKSKPKVPEPRFDFYTILPEKEEVVANKSKTAGAGQKPVSATPPLTPETPFRQGDPPKEGEPRYMLQLGSFKRLEDAERRRAELAMMTIPAEIQTVTINDGEVYHRVRSGPYSSEDAGLLGEKLSVMEINSLTIRLRD